MKIIVGSRGSKLALTQTRWVIEQLKQKQPEIVFEIKVIQTKGDRITDVSLDKIGDKGLFVKELEEELLAGTVDMAVHSMKDMPSKQPEGLIFAGVPKREDYRDAWILAEGYKKLEDIPIGGRIGTGSKRRKYQLLRLRPDLDIVPIRGNIDTRIRKMEEMGLCGIVLAAAGLIRLGIQDRISSYLDPNEMLPAPAQGALGIEICERNQELYTILKTIKDPRTEIEVKAERAFLETTGGSCHIPIGGLCVVENESITLHGMLGDPEGKRLIRRSVLGKVDDAEAVGRRLAWEILEEMKSYER